MANEPYARAEWDLTTAGTAGPTQREVRDAVEPFLQIPLRLHVGEGSCASPQPVTVGVPLPQGVVVGHISAAIETATGRRTCCQHEVLARWPDGSARWMLIDFVARAAQPVPLTLLLFRDAAGIAGEQMDVRKTADGWQVTAGPNQFHFTPGKEWLFRVSRGDAIAPDPVGVAHFTLSDARGRTHRPNIESIVPESVGPVRITFLVRGSLPRVRRLRFECRVCFFAAGGYVRIRPTLHNPRRARHRGGLWDLGDRGSVLFDDFSLHVVPPQSEARQVWYRVDRTEPLRRAGGDRVEIYQDSSGGPNWQSRNHVNRNSHVPCRLPGYRIRTGAGADAGRRAEPSVIIRDEQGDVEVALPEFWQQFPKALEADADALRVHLFPAQWNDRFELQGGERKTHTIWLSLLSANESPRCRLDWVDGPALVAPTAAWYERCGVFESFPTNASSDHPLFRDLLAATLAEDRGLIARREVIDEYGWRNFGDLWADHEEAYYSGPRPVISHYNNQYDVIEGTIRHFIRSGDPAWWKIADPLARHTLDIDLYHTHADRPEYCGGMFWHTDHYRDAQTSTHRTYSQKNASGREYGGGPSAAHVYSTGLLHYYYLTGDSLARDAVVELAEWLIRMEDGRLTELGVIDDGPTGCSTRDEPGYCGPGRASANAVNALLDAWELTRERRYLEQAEELIRRVVHPDDDIEELDLLNAERRWSYTMFLHSLCKYLDAKVVADELDQMHAFGVTCVRHYARWMLENERPYFDKPAQLEYPTETWGAQDVRKGNAMRRMARFCAEPLAGNLLRRGTELADRGWQDVFRFDTRYVARATAILLIEGLRDVYFRSWEERVTPGHDARGGSGSVGPAGHTPFLDQRARVRALLASPRGWERLVARLMRLQKWPAALRALSRRL